MRGLLSSCAAAAILAFAGGGLLATPARAAVSCPNANPIVNENQCMGPGTSSWRLDNESEDIGGYATQTSFDLGQDVPLKIARNVPTFPATHVDIAVYRAGSYGGLRARLIPAASATNVAVNNDYTCNPMDPVTGELDCKNWNVTYTIPGSSLPAGGVYFAKLTATDTGIQSYIVFVVRDDNRAPGSRILVVEPTDTWEAYNTWGGKSLYFDKNGGANTVSGAGRAVKVSFQRPEDHVTAGRDRFFGPDQDLIEWLESQGYDVSYTDDVHVHDDAASLRSHKVVAISGHSEYWSLEERNAVKAARDAGIDIASFSSNTAYWKVRYEDGGDTLVCYKTVQGNGVGSSSDGTKTPNDPGPDGKVGTADDALGADGIAGTADDNPQNATTTWRDNGAPPGDPNAPPGGRVGPDMPENELFGVMYVGDNDDANYPLTVPAADGDQYAGSSFWRNTGIAANSSTSIGTGIVGWEWDAIPTQAQYLSRQPAGVVSLSASDTTGGTPSWLQDEGRARALTPPPGQPGTVNAVEYTAPSGALVFASGTMGWAFALSRDSDPRIQQATYNVLSDMGVQPDTPSGITLDPSDGNRAPAASFQDDATGPVHLGVPVHFDASASRDPDGSIVKYEWDLDGDGTYETDTGSTPTVTKTYTTEGSYTIRLRVTDNGGATDFTVRTLDVVGNIAPTARFTVSPNPVVVGQTMHLDASASSDPDGSIAHYEWDLDGDGTYETDGGTKATLDRELSTTGTVQIGLRVTDDGGKSATTTVPVTVNQGGVSNYGDAVLDTPGLIDYWRMGETAGPTLADSKGSSPATLTGGTLGVPGGPALDSNTAIAFNGGGDFARADLDLSKASAVTVEFWMKWDRYDNNDSLAFEFTNNFNNNDGGFLIDPDAPQNGGTFAVSLGRGTARNTITFTRPSAGVWHQVAIVLDPTQAATSMITPYVDGQKATYVTTAGGSGVTSLANSTLYFMSRGGTTLFGNGSLDEVAIYDRALGADTIAAHYGSYGTNRRPVAAYTMTPNPAPLGHTVTFDASGSHDPDGSIIKYEWDLDGNGTYETDSGSDPTVTHVYSDEGPVDVGLRVTDDQYGTDTETHSLYAGNKPPTASFTVTPNPTIQGQAATLDASGSGDDDGSIVRYEWDLDGNGTYETDGGSTPTLKHAFTDTGTVQVGLRVTDDGGKTATATVPVTTNGGGVSSYGDAVLRTPGLVDYWRMGETSGTTLADSKGAIAADLVGGATLGVPGGVKNDPSTAVRFDGTTAAAKAPLDLSGTSAVTIEFWLKWNRYANDDHLAFEFTPNFNNVDGGFLVDPDAPQNGGTFGVGLGRLGARNNVYFARPSAGVWHHYAFVLDTTQPGASQITPYVDGSPVAYTKTSAGTGAGHFANSTLNFMSRDGSSLFGAGDLDEVAIYDRPLDASTINGHYGSFGTNRRPVAAFTATPSSLKPGGTVTFDASASNDPDGTIRDYEWDLDGNGTYETDTGTTPTVTHRYDDAGTVGVKLRVTDDQFGTDTATQAIQVADAPPVASATATPSRALVGDTVTFDASTSNDPDGSIARYEWDLDGDGTYETDSGSNPRVTKAYSAAGAVSVKLRVSDDAGQTATTTIPVSVKNAAYRQLVLSQPSLAHYWRMGAAAGSTTVPDEAAPTAVTLLNGTQLGVAGALAGDSDTAARFDRVDDAGQADVDLSSTTKLTVEFWMKWTQYGTDDRLAMEFTPNANTNRGGFLIDPNSANGKFGIGLGASSTRNNVWFDRPSAGVWHHYAFVLDTTQPGASQITPYVDGKPVSYTKTASATGSGAFARSRLFLMSRGAASLFGGGDLDEVALYTSALDAATIAAHYDAGTP